MDHGTAGKIESALCVEETVRAPYHVGDRAVDQQQPERHEYHVGAELHPLRDGAADERRGDDGEHHLVDHVDLMRNGCAVVGIWELANSTQPEPFEAADEWRSLCEGQRVAHYHPEYRHHRKRN